MVNGGKFGNLLVFLAVASVVVENILQIIWRNVVKFIVLIRIKIWLHSDCVHPTIERTVDVFICFFGNLILINHFGTRYLRTH